MSFYLTLPSTASAREIPGNRQTNFTTLYRPAIELQGNYEVALCEITYSTRYLVDLGALTLHNPYGFSSLGENIGRQATTQFKLEAFNGTNTEGFLKDLNKTIRHTFLEAEYRFREKLSNDDPEAVQKIKDYHDNQTRNFPHNTEFHAVVLDRDSQCELIISQETFKTTIEDFAKLKYNVEKQRYIFDPSVLDLLAGKTDHPMSSHASFAVFKKFTIQHIKIHDKNTTDRLDATKHFNLADPDSDVVTDAVYKDLESSFVSKLSKRIPFFAYINTRLRIEFEDNKPYEFNAMGAAVFTNQVEKLAFKTTQSYLMTPTLNTINNAVVLTDLIDDQYFGDTMSPVLYTLNLKSSSTAETVTVMDNPQYLPVKKSYISSINIQLFDLTGQPIKFSDIFSVVILKLHFKKVQDY